MLPPLSASRVRKRLSTIFVSSSWSGADKRLLMTGSMLPSTEVLCCDGVSSSSLSFSLRVACAATHVTIQSHDVRDHQHQNSDISDISDIT